MKHTPKVITAIAIAALVVLAYGYWHALSHDSAYIDLTLETSDTAKKDLLSKARVLFIDVHGDILAQGVRDEEYDFIHLVHPTAGDCHQFEKNAAYSNASKKLWRERFANQSTWIPTWINDVSQVQVMHRECSSKPLSIVISASNNEWFLWWVPHPHIGGKPYTYFRSSILVTEKDCMGALNETKRADKPLDRGP